LAELEGIASPTNAQKARLTELKSELAHIMKKKEDYVKEHPESRNLVYKRRHDKQKGKEIDEVEEGKPAVRKERNLFKKNGLPRHPERSIYYDEIMNPYGMPPPGMPYQERRKL
jgi:hypothetical protein